MYVIIRSRISLIMDLIGLELSELSAPWIRKFAIFDFVYTLASTNIDQSVPNLATIFLPIRSQMSLIMKQIKPEHLELFALEFGKIDEYDFVYTVIYKYWPINTKLGQNVCDHKVSDEFDYGLNPMRTVGVICPWIRKFAVFGFVYTLASANIDQSVPNLATIFQPIRSQMSLIMKQIKPSGVIYPWIWKNCWIHSSIYKYWAISTKLGQNVCDHKISDEFDNGCLSYFTLNLQKLLNLTLFTL